MGSEFKTEAPSKGGPNSVAKFVEDKYLIVKSTIRVFKVFVFQ